MTRAGWWGVCGCWGGRSLAAPLLWPCHLSPVCKALGGVPVPSKATAGRQGGGSTCPHLQALGGPTQGRASGLHRGCPPCREEGGAREAALPLQ